MNEFQRLFKEDSLELSAHGIPVELQEIILMQRYVRLFGYQELVSLCAQCPRIPRYIWKEKVEYELHKTTLERFVTLCRKNQYYMYLRVVLMSYDLSEQSSTEIFSHCVVMSKTKPWYAKMLPFITNVSEGFVRSQFNTIIEKDIAPAAEIVIREWNDTSLQEVLERSIDNISRDVCNVIASRITDQQILAYATIYAHSILMPWRYPLDITQKLLDKLVVLGSIQDDILSLITDLDVLGGLIVMCIKCSYFLLADTVLSRVDQDNKTIKSYLKYALDEAKSVNDRSKIKYITNVMENS